ncbi:MAG: helix-turn-helix domain-containing protein [Fidelibacterota bacterium]
MREKVLHIKNMVCNRCIRVVREELEKLGLIVEDVKLGHVIIGNPEEIDIEQVSRVLQENDFELLVEKKARLVEKIKMLIIDLVQSGDLEFMNINLSDYLRSKIGHEYAYLSGLFSAVESITIEKYFILQKIEKVKECLVYNENTLSEISYRLGYSSVQHLSSQFKKVTGFTPTQFKRLKKRDRRSLDKVASAKK